MGGPFGVGTNLGGEEKEVQPWTCRLDSASLRVHSDSSERVQGLVIRPARHPIGPTSRT